MGQRVRFHVEPDFARRPKCRKTFITHSMRESVHPALRQTLYIGILCNPVSKAHDHAWNDTEGTGSWLNSGSLNLLTSPFTALSR